MPDVTLTGNLIVADGTGGVSPPAGSVLDLGCEGQPAVSIDLEGTFSATLVIEATTEVAPTNPDWFTPLLLTAAQAAGSATLTAPGRRFLNAAGLARVRVRCTGYVSGTPALTLRAGQGFVPLSTVTVQGNVGGITTTVNATLTRPANQTPYTAGDEMTDTGGAILTLTGIATKTGGTGVITGVEIACSSNAATKPDLTLWFYDTTSTPATDNAAFAPSDGVQNTYLGKVRITDFAVGDATANTGNFAMSSGQLNIPFTTVGSANLFVRAQVNAAYTAGTVSDTYLLRVKALADN